MELMLDFTRLLGRVYIYIYIYICVYVYVSGKIHHACTGIAYRVGAQHYRHPFETKYRARVCQVKREFSNLLASVLRSLVLNGPTAQKGKRPEGTPTPEPRALNFRKTLSSP